MGVETLAVVRIGGIAVRDTPAERMRAETVTGTIFLNMIAVRLFITGDMVVS